MVFDVVETAMVLRLKPMSHRHFKFHVIYIQLFQFF